MRKGWFILFLFLILTSCKQPKELVYQDVQNISFKQAGLQKTTISMDVRLYNPNKYRLHVKKSDIDVYLDNNPVGKITIRGGTIIDKRDTSSVPVMLEVDLKNALPNLIQVVMTNEITLKLSGAIIAGRHGLFIKVPVYYEGKQDILGGIIKL
jgi:LEA14-like dessication related protein